jgi:hypothetical protein
VDQGEADALAGLAVASKKNLEIRYSAPEPSAGALLDPI